MQFWRRVRIFLVWAILIFSLVLTTIASLVYYNRESLIELFVEKANRYLNSPIEINSIDLDITGNFPYATFRLNHVKVYESTDIAMDYLAEAEKIEFSYNVLLLLFRQYEINALSMYNARVNIGRGSEGARNYMIFQKNDQGSTDMEFSLKTISLYNTTVNYLDTENEVMFSVRTNELESKLRYSNDLLKVDLAGRIRNDSLVVRGISYLQGEVLELNTNFDYQFSESQINFDESRILINGHEFSLSGYINSGSLKVMDLDIASRKNDMHALVSLMPAPVRQSLSEFKSEGEITFSGKIAGEFSEGNRPAISFIFNGKDVDFYYPGYKNSFNRLNFSGYYNNGDSHDFAGSSLVIEHFSGYIDEHNIQ